jgi:hypothetical protein
MIIYIIISLLARIFMPHDAVLVNQKLRGYWIIVEDNRAEPMTDSVIVAKFNKCKSAKRKDHQCEYNWAVLDSLSVENFKLNKEVKKNWIPDVTKTYWVEPKKDKKTKREIIHIEGFNEVSIHLIKKEVDFYSGDSLMITIRKLK